MARLLRVIAPAALAACVLTIPACSSDSEAPEATADALTTALSDHDPDSLAKVLQGTPAQASQIIDATRGFTPSTGPLIGGKADSALISCVWIRGQADEKDSYVVGQLLWDTSEERWVVLPGSLPGIKRGNALPCSDPPGEVSTMRPYQAPTTD